MTSYQNQFKRVEIVSSRYEAGHLLVTVKGMAGETFRDLVWHEPHGFHSRPAAGATGHLMIPGGRSDMGFVMAASDPAKVPQIGEGHSAMYDATGNVVHLSDTGWEFNMDVRINGTLHVTGNITSGGSITDADGDGGA